MMMRQGRGNPSQPRFWCRRRTSELIPGGERVLDRAGSVGLVGNLEEEEHDKRGARFASGVFAVA